jgi:ABC-2 type transport system ATP-binding protein
MQSGHAATAIAPVVCAGAGVRYGSVWAIRLASFRLAQSDLGTATLGIVPDQPAVRAILVGLLSGRIAPTYGNLVVLGHDMRTASGRAAARRQVGISGRSPRALPAIRVRGLVEHAARQANQSAADRHLLVAAIIDRLALSPWAGVQLRAAPELVARKARLAAACVHQPKLLLLDGLLDQLGTRDRIVLADVIAGLRGEAAMILLGEDPDALSLVCDRVLTLANGIVTDGVTNAAPLFPDSFAVS